MDKNNMLTGIGEEPVTVLPSFTLFERLVLRFILVQLTRTTPRSKEANALLLEVNEAVYPVTAPVPCASCGGLEHRSDCRLVPRNER